MTSLLDGDLDQLRQAGREGPIRVGQQLFRAGQKPDYVVLVVSGRVRLWCDTDQGQVMVLRECGAGELLGQMSALDGSSHSVNATVCANGRVARIPVARFRELVDASPELARRIIAALSQRVRDLSDRLEQLKYGSIADRVKRWLMERGVGRREIAITHQELAEQVGSNRENVSRVLSDLRKRGIIRTGRGRIEILDHYSLATC